MNIERAKELLSSTHLASIRDARRANGYMLQSGPGIGKTEGTHQYCRALARKVRQPVGLVVMMLASITSPDVRGFMIPLKADGGGIPRTVFSIPPWYPVRDNIYVFTPDGQVYRPGEWQDEVPDIGVVFLDEWGQAEEDVRKPAAELVLNGVVGTHRLPEGWRVVGAQNRVSDRSGVMRELMHIVNRRCLLEIEASVDTWLAWADDLPDEERPHALTRAFARKQPDIVFRDRLPDSADPYCTPRSLVMMDRDIRVLRTEEDEDRDRFPMSELARELCAGFIGAHAAGQFFTHIRFADELPDFEDILNNPRTAKVPAAKDAQMIVSYMLADAVDDDTAKPIVRYVMRLSKEMQMLAMGVMVGATEKTIADQAKTNAQLRRQKAVMPLPEYTQWLMENKDILKAAQM